MKLTACQTPEVILYSFLNVIINFNYDIRNSADNVTSCIVVNNLFVIVFRRDGYGSFAVVCKQIVAFGRDNAWLHSIDWRWLITCSSLTDL